MRPRRASLLVVPPLEPGRLLSCGLVIVEHAVLDDHEVVRLHAIVVIADRGKAAFLRTIALDLHEVLSIAKIAKDLLRRCEEAGAGIVRLVAHCSIQLRWVTNRLVDGEP